MRWLRRSRTRWAEETDGALRLDAGEGNARPAPVAGPGIRALRAAVLSPDRSLHGNLGGREDRVVALRILRRIFQRPTSGAARATGLAVSFLDHQGVGQ